MKEPKQLNSGDPYSESNRKTRAFYATLAVVAFLFIGSHWWEESPADTIDGIIQLAMVYIGGLAINDSVRYYKFGSKTLGNPESSQELKDRYADK
jgi:hypothetical protein